jgi:putative sterol carrier protein
MVDQELVDRIEDSLEQDQNALEADLPGVLSDVEGRTDDLVREHPQVMADILSRMEGMDVASFVTENPETADQFQELLWSGMRVMVERNPEVKDQITENITTNFEADDCPMEGHLRVDEDEATITGGAGQLDDADLTITGPADVLVGLVTGDVDPMTGFMRGQFELDGSMGTATKLAPILNGLANQLPD